MENLNENAEEILNNEEESLADSVVDEQAEGKPQPSDETEEFEVDIGSDEQESQSNKIPAYKLKKMRKRAQSAESEAKLVNNENESLRAEVAELKQQFAVLGAGEKPDPLDYSSKEEFYAALSAYETKIKPANPVAKPQAQNDHNFSNDAVFDEHYERAAKLPVNDYQEAEKAFRDEMGEVFGDKGHLVADSVIISAGDKSDLVSYALGKNASKRNKFVRLLTEDLQTGSNKATEMIWELKKEVNVKPKQKRVETDPEEIPQGAGNASALENKIQSAMKAWQADPTVSNHKKLNSLRKQRNG